MENQAKTNTEQKEQQLKKLSKMSLKSSSPRRNTKPLLKILDDICMYFSKLV